MIDVASPAPESRRPDAAPATAGENLAGQTAVITGASSGIGAAIARALGARGVTVCLLGRRRQALEEVAQSVRGRALVFSLDLSVPEQIETFALDLARHEQPNILVHGAGVIALGATESASLADLDLQLKVNLIAPFLLTQSLLSMLKSRRGQIVFINSSAGLNAAPGSGQYAATKHALKALADSLRQEINPNGVRVLDVFVGRTATPMQETVHALEGRRYLPDRLIQPEDVASVVTQTLSLPRTVEVTAVHMRPMARLD